jgi:hypothetical protein
MTNETLTRAATNTGTVHVVRPSRFAGSVVLDCSGRTVRYAVGTEEPVTCGSCLKRHAGKLVVLGEVAQ